MPAAWNHLGIPGTMTVGWTSGASTIGVYLTGGVTTGGVAHASIKAVPGYQVALAEHVKKASGIVTRAVGAVEFPARHRDAEQCDRLTVPEIAEMASLDKVLSDWPVSRALLLCPWHGTAQQKCFRLEIFLRGAFDMRRSRRLV